MSVPVFKGLQQFLAKFTKPLMSKTFGRADSRFTLSDYQALAQKTGFHLTSQEDITHQTLPTYPVVRRVFDQTGYPVAARDTAAIEKISGLGLLQYVIFSFVVES